MKLASALTERADIQRRLNELSIRLINNAKVCAERAGVRTPT